MLLLGSVIRSSRNYFHCASLYQNRRAGVSHFQWRVGTALGRTGEVERSSPGLPPRSYLLSFGFHGAGADVFAVLHAVEVDFGDGEVGFGAGVFDGVAEGGDGEDASAAGDEFAVLHGGAAVEDEHVGGFCGFVQTGDFHAFGHLIVGLPAITFAGDDDADGGAGIPGECGLIEFLIDGGEHDFDEVALEADHECLAFGIAEAGVEFEDLGAAGGEHKAGVEDSAEVDFVAFERVHEWDDDFALDLVDDGIGEERRGGVGTHAAGVGAGVIFADAFVVLCAFHEVGVDAVDEREERDFRTLEAFFDDDGAARVAEYFFLHHVSHGIKGFDGVGADDDAFAFGEAGGFDDERFGAGFDESDGGLEAGEGAAFAGGDACVAHHFFGEGFVGFELCAGAGRSEGADVFFREGIDEAERERVFGADDDEVGFDVDRCLDEAGDVIRFDGQ